MSVQVRARREAASFLSSFVGAQGELLVDTTNNRVQVHDGVKPGGSPAAKLAEVITNTRTAVADAAYTVLPGDRTIAVTSLTAPRTITLPAAAAYPTGTQLLVFDESGSCSATNVVTVARTGTDTINGAASASIASAYGYLAFESNGVARWTIVDQTASTGGASGTLAIANGGTGATTANGALLSLGVIGRTAVADAAYTVLAADRTVAVTALTAARTLTLPAASAYPIGTPLLIVDESGACSATNTITVTRAGSDTINGATSAILALAYGFLSIVGNGSGKWTIIDQSTTALAQQAIVGNAFLAQMPALTLKANLGGAAAIPTDSAPSAILDAAFGSTRGAILYRGAGGWAPLAPGSTGNVLTSNGAGADPTYQAAAGTSGPQNNYAATANPTSTNDSAQGYAAGSMWMRSDTGDVWRCRVATAGAAVWVRLDPADFFGYVAGNWYAPPGIIGSVNGSPLSANRIVFYPIDIKQRCTISALGLNVVTGASGTNAQVGWFASDPVTKVPTGAPLVTTASISTATAAGVNATATVLAEIGLYWLGVNFDSASAVFTCSQNSVFYPASLIGFPSLATFATNSLNIYITYSQTFNSWPTLTNALWTSNAQIGASNVSYQPLVYFKIASVP